MDVTHHVQQRVRDSLAADDLLAGVTRVYVGFSGGADSTACLLLLRSLHPDVVAVHLNHGLRGAEADADEAWCRQFCEARLIPFSTASCRVYSLPWGRSRTRSRGRGRRSRAGRWPRTGP
jgi:tRNA(Ile)-lysidine synthase